MFLKYKYEINCRLGRSEVVVGVAAYLATATSAVEDVVVEVGIAKARLKLKVDALREHEGKAIRHADTIGITLVAHVP